MKGLTRIIKLLFVCGGILLLTFGSIDAYAASSESGNVIVKNKREFYDAICNQILNNQKEVTYLTYASLVTADKDTLLNDFMYHINEADPTKSGCNMINYVNCLSYSYTYGSSVGSEYNCKIKVELKLKYSKSELDEFFSYMDSLAYKLKRKTDYKTVKAVHDYLIKNYEYDSDCNLRTDVDGYKTGYMVCAGYCMATYYLLSRLNIPVRLVLGSSDNTKDDINHGWNVVKVDGLWYNMDVTWDDPGGKGFPQYNYFLKSDNDFPNHIRSGYYDYDAYLAKESYKIPWYLDMTNVYYLIVAFFFLINFMLMVRRNKLNKQKQLELERMEYYADQDR